MHPVRLCFPVGAEGPARVKSCETGAAKELLSLDVCFQTIYEGDCLPLLATKKDSEILQTKEGFYNAV